MIQTLIVSYQRAILGEIYLMRTEYVTNAPTVKQCLDQFISQRNCQHDWILGQSPVAGAVEVCSKCKDYRQPQRNIKE